MPNTIQTLLSSSRLQVAKPDGNTQTDYSIVDFHRKSVATALMDQDGSYRITLIQNPIYFTWFKDAKGELNRRFGKAHPNKKTLPKSAYDFRTTKLVNTVETYVTRNNINNIALNPRGTGLELEFISHPNELFVEERFRVKVLFNNTPLTNSFRAKLIPHGTRYRNNREEVELSTKKNGELEITWTEPGMYLLEIEYELNSMESGIKTETHANYLVLEVFPE